MPMYWIRAAGGTLYLTGGLFCGVNLLKTWAARPAKYEETVHEAPALSPKYVEPPVPESRLKGAAVIDFAHCAGRLAARLVAPPRRAAAAAVH